MGALTPFLQEEFSRRCPPDWHCRREVRVIPARLEQLLGYNARVDLLLERSDGSRRLWVEFEISRADPVANHAKFATAHLFQPQAPSDSFVAMVSPHVTRGRRNLAANAIHLMREIGMSAFQTVLLPYMSPQSVQKLNQSDTETIVNSHLDIESEIKRLMAVAEPAFVIAGSTVHFSGDLLEVMLNVRQWNQDIQEDSVGQLWGSRVITYFVFDPVSGDFAPAKFCAYIRIEQHNRSSRRTDRSFSMTIGAYTSIESSLKAFDGFKARHHLSDRLGMQSYGDLNAAGISMQFRHWLDKVNDHIIVGGNGPIFLMPPIWFK